jgi:putative photosynthetic complex assembly protein 2
MSLYLVPPLVAVLLWWFTTGAVLLLDGLPRSTFAVSMLGGTVMFAAALHFVWMTGADTTAAGAYVAFAAAMLAWAWVELGFYLGVLVGPRPRGRPVAAGAWRRFAQAVHANLWHELAILLVGVAIALLLWHQPNRLALRTFLALAIMHESARLNVFLGVPNLNEAWLPPHLAFLAGFMRRRPMNVLFPLSVTCGTVAVAMLFARASALAASAPGAATGAVLLGTLLLLGVLEHWMLVLPLPFARLWGWALRLRTAMAALPWPRRAPRRSILRRPVLAAAACRESEWRGP